jgi:rare lipoprotein A
MRMKDTMNGAWLRRWKTAWLFPALLATAFCVRRTAPLSLGPADSPVGGHALSGMASWYGDDFQGKPTSNRETYDMYAMTAAHKTLPFETRVRVVNLDNGKSTAVRINDRGPFIDGRIIDLSLAAARAIDLVGPGTAPVRLEILSGPPPAARPAFSVQVGSFLREENARELETGLKDRFGPVSIVPFDSEGRTYYRVRLRAAGRESAVRLADRLARAGYRALVLDE